MTTRTATATNTKGTIQVRTAAAGSGRFARFAGSTSRRAFRAVIHVQPSTHSVATRPVTTDSHITGSDHGCSSINRRTCQPINAKVIASMAAPPIRHGAIDRSVNPAAAAIPTRDVGDGGMVVQATALGGGGGAVAIRCVTGATGATGSPGGVVVAPRGRGSSGSMSSSSACGLSDLSRNCPGPAPPRRSVSVDQRRCMSKNVDECR